MGRCYRTLQSVVTGSPENCLSDVASRPANSATQGAPNARPSKHKNGPPLYQRSGRFVCSACGSNALTCRRTGAGIGRRNWGAVIAPTPRAGMLASVVAGSACSASGRIFSDGLPCARKQDQKVVFMTRSAARALHGRSTVAQEAVRRFGANQVWLGRRTRVRKKFLLHQAASQEEL